jgi:cell fate regulator YaaT (PSP1 superfamily)
LDRLVHLKFDKEGRNGWFKSSLPEHHLGQLCVAKIKDGLAVGKVDSISELKDDKIAGKVTPIVREATKEDLKKIERDTRKERHAASVFQNRIKKYKLPMKLVEVESHFSEKKITFYFTSQERVDFGSLVKDLARAFKCRIELRQIGEREKSRRLGGFGSCGRLLCCKSFLENFEPVTMKMAKEQKLPPDSLKLGGMCGKLRCCLRYELPYYREKKKQEKSKSTTTS